MGDIAGISKQATSGQICPECAAPASQREVRPPWPVRRRRLVQIAVLLIALGYVVWRHIEAWPVLLPPTVHANVPYTAEFPRHRYTRVDIERYASGEASDERLIGDLHQVEGFYGVELGVAFVPAVGEGTEFRRYGWPTEFVIYRYDAQYDDAYAKTNPSARPSTRPNGWQYGRTYVSSRIDARGRRETFLFVSKGLAGGPLMLLVAWCAGRLMRGAAFAIHIAEREGKGGRDRFARRLPLLCVVACAIGVTVASLVPRIDPGYAFPVPWNPAISDTGLFASDIAQLIREPTGEAGLARRILDVTSDASSTPDANLAIAWRSDFGVAFTDARGGWPAGVVGKRVYEQEGFTASGRPEFSLKFRRTLVEVIARFSESRERMVHYSFSFYNAAQLALGLAVLWIAAGLGVWLVSWTVRRRTARRLARGWCVQCGYDLKGLRDAGENVTRA